MSMLADQIRYKLQSYDVGNVICKDFYDFSPKFCTKTLYIMKEILIQFTQFIEDIHSSIQGGTHGADASVIPLTIQFQNFMYTNFVSP